MVNCFLCNLMGKWMLAAVFLKNLRQLVPAVIFISIFSACGGKSSSGEAQDSVSADEQLARQYCGNCHLYPEPEKLNKFTWKYGVFPAMGPKMGIYRHGGMEYTSPEKGDTNLSTIIFPDQAVIDTLVWGKILDFYLSRAPEAMPPQVRNSGIGDPTGLFSAMSPAPEVQGPMTVFVRIDPKRKLIFYGEGNGNTLSTYGPDLKRRSKINLQGAPAWLHDAGNSLYVTNIGSIYPSNKKEGSLQEVRIDAQGGMQAGALMLNRLGRPVMIQKADIDGNGKEDWIVNGFGHLEGEFFWLPDGDRSRKKMLRKEPGAIKTIITDFNNDGKTDLVTLFCQGKEGVYLFENQGDGEFKERRLLEFSSVNGSSGFELADMNGDGHRDIVYTAGDNADYSMVLKNFHGVYIYLNDGKNNFSQPAWFFPVNGCYKALVRDFDLDGDLDMLSLSFFADYANQEREILLLFTNQGNLQFLPRVVDGYRNGRWLTADAGDIDGDGDEDVVLGNFSQGPGQVPREAAGHWMMQAGFMLLRNNTR